MGQHDGLYPAALAAERVCLGPGCEETFEPAGPRELYCSPECERANNGGPRRRPAVTAANRSLPRAEVERREAFVQQVAALLERPHLVVVRVEPCPRCATDHEVYAIQEVPDAPAAS